MHKNKRKTEKKGKVISMKFKLLAIIIPVVVVMAGILVLFSYRISKELLEDAAHNTLELSVSKQSTQIEAWLDENLASFNMAKQTIETARPDDALLQTMLDGYYGFNSNFNGGMYIALQNGHVMKASQSDMNVVNVKDSVWYKQGITRKNMAYTSAYQNDKGENVVSASGILADGSGELKVIAADLSIDRITVIVNSFIDMEGAQAFLVDRDTENIIAHRDSSLVSSRLDSNEGDKYFNGVASKLKDGSLEYSSIEGNMTVFKEISGTSWILVSYVPESLVLADVNGLRNKLAVMGVVLILFLCIIIDRAVYLMIRPVSRLTDTITAMSSGDFTVDVNVKGHDEVALMGRSVKQFTASMRDMLKDVYSISEQLNGQAQNSDNISSELYEAAQTQAGSMSELNTTVDQLSISVNEIAENASRLAQVVTDTHEDGSHVDEKMKNTVEVSNRGRSDMQKVGAAMEYISKSIIELREAVDKVGEASEEITKITGLIGEIADETNLLSLNASIEAARAGEMGKGFNVVAAQIGRLAQNSSESAGNIAKLIGQIRELVDNAVKQAGTSSKNIDESSKLIYTALETFDIIYENIEEADKMITHMINKVGEVDQVATSVAAISQEQAASSDEILVTSENMVVQAGSISDNSRKVADDSKVLAETAERLSKQVNTFRI
ncbi:MAG TPA: methyl-accepting chemotaxis protein [Lachnospiraceae bacterium]|nr:methyl-accepting chemotaxis protein [Lachnospiraceae bacterium]